MFNFFKRLASGIVAPDASHVALFVDQNGVLSTMNSSGTVTGVVPIIWQHPIPNNTQTEQLSYMLNNVAITLPKNPSAIVPTLLVPNGSSYIPVQVINTLTSTTNFTYKLEAATPNGNYVLQIIVYP